MTKRRIACAVCGKAGLAKKVYTSGGFETVLLRGWSRVNAGTTTGSNWGFYLCSDTCRHEFDVDPAAHIKMDRGYAWNGTITH